MNDKPERDLAKIFDLDRSTLIKNFVMSMEECLKGIQIARDDLKEIVAKCREAEIPARDIAAMKKIAKLRLEDKAPEAAANLEALERISAIVGFDLFGWAAQHDKAAE